MNLGLSLPTPAGVASAVGRFATANFAGSLQWGSMGGVHASFAKDLFPDLYVGLGLGFEFGSDWALWGDLGFLNTPGDIGPMKDFTWGVALRGLGKGFSPASSSSTLSWPPVFTPAIGASFALVKTGPFLIQVNGDLSLPGVYQDLRLMLGVNFSAANVLSLSLATDMDLRQAMGLDPVRSLPLGFGLSLKIRTDIKNTLAGLGASNPGWNQTELKTTTSALSLRIGRSIPWTPPGLLRGLPRIASPGGGFCEVRIA